MKTFDVVIRATITKTIRVEAKSGNEACEIAAGQFTVAPGDDDERYEQEETSWEEVQP